MILQSVINEISPPICQFPRFIINTISFWIRYTFLKTALLLSCTGDNTYCPAPEIILSSKTAKAALLILLLPDVKLTSAINPLPI